MPEPTKITQRLRESVKKLNAITTGLQKTQTEIKQDIKTIPLGLPKK